MENQFEVYRDGELDPTFKRKIVIKKIKNAISHVGALGLDVIYKLVDDINKALTPVKLDLIDHKYGTNLRAQYFAGRRTQQILATKRAYGL